MVEMEIKRMGEKEYIIESITLYVPKTLGKAKELFEKFKQMKLENLDEEKFFFLFEKGMARLDFV